MPQLLLALLTSLTFSLLAQPQSAIGQIAKIKGLKVLEQEESERDGDLQISTGIGLGSNGFKSHTNIKLVNELGIAYDSFSLLSRPEVRDAIGVDQDQYSEMAQLHLDLVAEVEEKLVDLIMADDKDLIEARFYEVESQLTDSLSSNQVQQINQIMIQEGIAHFGMQKMLSTSHLQEQLGLSDEDLKALPDQDGSTSTSIQSESFASANERLIAELKPEQADQLESYFEKFDSEFMASPLFAGKSHKAYSDRVQQNSLWQAVRNRKLREHLELTEDQIEELNQLRRNAEKDSDAAELIADVLTEEQTTEFQTIVVAKQTERWGTTRALANGYLSSLLEIDQQQSEQLVELGQQLHRELEQGIRVAKFEGLLGQLDALPRSKREKVRNLIGDQINLARE